MCQYTRRYIVEYTGQVGPPRTRWAFRQCKQVREVSVAGGNQQKTVGKLARKLVMRLAGTRHRLDHSQKNVSLSQENK